MQVSPSETSRQQEEKKRHTKAEVTRQRHVSKIKTILSHLIIYKEHVGCSPAYLAAVVQADKVNSGVNKPCGSSHAV